MLTMTDLNVSENLDQAAMTAIAGSGISWGRPISGRWSSARCYAKTCKLVIKHGRFYKKLTKYYRRARTQVQFGKSCRYFRV